MTSTPVELSTATLVRSIETAPVDVAIVALPFYTQYSACLPAMLLREIVEAAGDRSQVVYSHIDFPLQFIRNQEDHNLYKRFGHEGYLADLVLLPLFAGWDDSMAVELNEFGGRIDAPGLEFQQRFRDAFDQHLQELAERLGPAAIVALTATHYQLVPALLLAERLEQLFGKSRPRIVIGGYFGSEANAQGVLAAHPEIDCIVYGEAEDVWPMVRASIEQSNRIVIRGSARNFGRYTPRHDDILRHIAAVPWFAKRFQATFELSRGCYWDKCDFCNFNASYDAVFKSHTVDSILHEMDRLHRVYGQTRFQLTDTAVPKKLANRLRDEDINREWSVFMELRPDFDYDDFAALSKLGTIRAQIGIESLVESHLLRMNKNATIGDNVRALLICQQLEIVPTWGLFVEHPHETLDELRQMLGRAETWQHLPPPKYVNRCEIRGGSPLSQDHSHAAPETACSPYELILRSSVDAYDLIPFPTQLPSDLAERRVLVTQIETAADSWRAAYARGARLTAEPIDTGVLNVIDTRSGQRRTRLLDQSSSIALLLAVERGTSVEAVVTATGLPSVRATDVLEELVEQGLAFWSRGRRSEVPVFESLVGGLHPLGKRLPVPAAGGK